MKMTRFTILLTVTLATFTAFYASAALVESVESTAASTAFQKVDSFLSEKIVTEQLTALGLTSEQTSARLAELSETQLQQLAAEVDLIKAGGTIQGGHPNPLGPFGYLFKQVGAFLGSVYRLLFSWKDLP